MSFLLVAVGLSIIGSLVLWAANRKPKTFMSSIDDFEREMKALGREPDPGSGGRPRPAGTIPRQTVRRADPTPPAAPDADPEVELDEGDPEEPIP